MDTKIIKELGSEILCYKLKTARQKKRAVKTANEKNLLRLHREQRQIRQYQRGLGYVDIDPPIVKGWKRYFVLREDVARCNQAAFYQGILDKINTVVYCNRKDFKVKKWRFRKYKNWKPIEQTVLQPGHYEFMKLNFSEKEEALFEERLVRHKYRNELVTAFVFTEQWRFVLRVRQHVITKVKAIDGELERREKEIWDYLERSNKGDELSRLLGHRVGRDRRWDDNPKVKEQFDSKTILQIIDEIKEIVDENTSTQKLA